MDYVPPVGGAANDPYIDANPGGGIEGSAVPAAAIENPQREIIEAITQAGLVPAGGDLAQLAEAIALIASQQVPQSYIAGLVPSNNALDLLHDLEFSPGVARYNDNTGQVRFTSTIVKRFDAAFVKGSGNGGLGNTVTLPVSDTLHTFAVTEDATGDADIYGDTDFSGANVPADFTLRRRITSVRTDATNNIRKFLAMELSGGGLEVLLDDPVNDVLGNVLGNTYTLFPLTVPVGFPVRALVSTECRNPTSALRFFVRTPGITNEGLAGVVVLASAGDIATSSPYPFRTNSLAQIEAKTSGAGSANTSFDLQTQGWIDERR